MYLRDKFDDSFRHYRRANWHSGSLHQRLRRSSQPERVLRYRRRVRGRVSVIGALRILQIASELPKPTCVHVLPASVDL